MRLRARLGHMASTSRCSSRSSQTPCRRPPSRSLCGGGGLLLACQLASALILLVRLSGPAVQLHAAGPGQPGGRQRARDALRAARGRQRPDLPVRQGALHHGSCLGHSLTCSLTLPRIAPLQVVPYLAAFAQTTKQQLASQGALALNATAGLLQGDTAPATAFEQATAMIIKMQASPLPTALTIRRGREACCRSAFRWTPTVTSSDARFAQLRHLHPRTAASERRRQCVPAARRA